MSSETVGLIFAALIQGTLILWYRLIAVLSVQCQHVKINLTESFIGTIELRGIYNNTRPKD